MDVTRPNFETEILKLPVPMPVKMRYWAAWLGSCRLAARAINTLAGSYGGKFEFRKVNIGTKDEITLHYGIHRVPTAVMSRTVRLPYPRRPAVSSVVGKGDPGCNLIGRASVQLCWFMALAQAARRNCLGEFILKILLLVLSTLVTVFLPNLALAGETSCDAVGKLEPDVRRRGVGKCWQFDKLRNTHNPLDLYRNAGSCIEAEDFQAAAMSAALGSAFEKYDLLRLPYGIPYAPPREVWLNYLSSIPEVAAGCLYEKMHVIMADEKALKGLCATVKRIGPPNYSLEYLLNGRRITDSSGKKLPSSMDGSSEAEAWEEAMRTRLLCP